MNFIKKIAMLTFAVALMSNIECMQESQRNLSRDEHKDSVAISEPRKDAFHIGDYLTQLASIYCTTSTNELHVSTLAAARIAFNGCHLWKHCKRLITSGAICKEDIVAGLGIYFRGKKNISKDMHNWKHASAIASKNVGRKNDKNLDNKKICQYVWVTLNKVLPIIVAYHRSKENEENMGSVYFKLIRSISNLTQPMLVELSELYRQKLMYAMIANKNK